MNIVIAAMKNEVLDLKIPEQYLYNAIKCIKYDLEQEHITKEQASSLKEYAIHVDYNFIKKMEEEYKQYERMLLDICHAVDMDNLKEVKEILIKNNFQVKCEEQECLI